MLVLAVATDAFAPLSVSVAALVSRADVIVAGQVNVSSEAGPFSIAVDKVLKGTPGTTRLPFRGEGEPLFHAPEEPIPYGILFLKRSAGSAGDVPWIALGTSTRAMMLRDVVLPGARGALSAEYASRAEATGLDRVVGEIRCALATETDPDRLGAGYEALFSLRWPPETEAGQPSPQTVREEHDAQIALALRTMEARLANTIRDRQVAGEPLTGELTSLLGRVEDPQAVPALGALVTSPASDRSIRTGATYALRVIHSEPSLPFLAALLDDEDRELAYHGMMGLAAFATGMPVGSTRESGPVVPHEELLRHSPSIPLFDTDPKRYLDYWRGWWKCQACGLDHPDCVPSICAARPGYAPDPAPR